MAAYRSSANPATLYTEYYCGLVNNGCPEVYGWCPTGVPFQFKFYSHYANKSAGALTVEYGYISDINYVIREEASTLPFMCESK
jgi:hypothetical protein